jgi:hypothetical protein
VIDLVGSNCFDIVFVNDIDFKFVQAARPDKQQVFQTELVLEEREIAIDVLIETSEKTQRHCVIVLGEGAIVRVNVAVCVKVNDFCVGILVQGVGNGRNRHGVITSDIHLSSLDGFVNVVQTLHVFIQAVGHFGFDETMTFVVDQFRKFGRRFIHSWFILS